MLSFFLLDVLVEILDLIESVSDDFLSTFARAKVKIMYYLETVAAIGLTVGLNIQINETMKFK